MSEENNVQNELIDLLQKLEETEPIDEKYNPFSILPKKDLIQLKKHIEEISQDLTYWKEEADEKTSN